MLAPLALCPATRPAIKSSSVRVILSTLQYGNPVTLQISSIGNGVRPGKYVTLLGPSLIIPVVYA